MHSEVFDGLNLRVHGKDMSTFLKFLASCKGGPVSLYSADKMLFVEKEDGTLFSLSKPSIPMKSLLQALKSLSSAISKEEDKMLLSLDQNELILSDGTEKNKMVLTINVTDSKKPFPEEGIWVTHEYLQKMLAKQSQEEIEVGFILYEKDEQLVGGILCLSEDDGDARYTTDLVWQV